MWSKFYGCSMWLKFPGSNDIHVTMKKRKKMLNNVESTFLVASLLVSHSKTSKGEAFLWPTTAAAFEDFVELWSESADVLSDGPLMLRVIIW